MSKKQTVKVVSLQDLSSLPIQVAPEPVKEKVPEAQKKDPPPTRDTKVEVQKPQRQGIIVTVSKSYKAGTMLPSWYIIKDLHSDTTFVTTGENFEEKLCFDAIVLYERDGVTREDKPRAKITEVIDVPKWAKEIDEVFAMFDNYYVALTAQQLRQKYQVEDPLDAMLKDGLTAVGKAYVSGEPVLLFEKTEKA